MRTVSGEARTRKAASHRAALRHTPTATLVLAIAVAAARAQEGTPPPPDAATLLRQLASADANDIAWAAHHARELGDKQFQKALRTAFATWRSAQTEHAARARLHLLDAMIALDVRQPGSELLPLIDDDELGTAAFVLLVREPKVNEADLLTLFRRDWPELDRDFRTQRDRRTLAIGNLLAEQGTPGFAACLAKGLQLQLTTSVRSPQHEPAQRVFAIGGPGDPQPREPEPGWPAPPAFVIDHPLFQMVAPAIAMPSSAAASVSRRVHSAERLQSFTFKLGKRTLEGTAPAPGDALHWLATAARLTDALPAREAVVVDTGQPITAERLTAVRADMQRFLSALRQRLVERGALTEAEAAAMDIQVELTIEDQRTDKRTPLPPVPAAR